MTINIRGFKVGKVSSNKLFLFTRELNLNFLIIIFMQRIKFFKASLEKQLNIMLFIDQCTEYFVHGKRFPLSGSTVPANVVKSASELGKWFPLSGSTVPTNVVKSTSELGKWFPLSGSMVPTNVVKSTSGLGKWFPLRGSTVTTDVVKSTSGLGKWFPLSGSMVPTNIMRSAISICTRYGVSTVDENPNFSKWFNKLHIKTLDKCCTIFKCAM